MGCGSSNPSGRPSAFCDSINIKGEIVTRDINFKLILTGPSGAGKTQFFKTYMNDPNNPFTDKDKNTTYMNLKDLVLNRSLVVDSNRFGVTLWDLAGQTRDTVLTLTKNYFHESHGVILLFDVMNEESYKMMSEDWIDIIENNLNLDHVNGKLYSCQN